MKTEWIVDRLEGEQVVLMATDKTTVVFPKDKLPAEIKEGQVLYFKIETSLEEEHKIKESAKEILNEILNTD